MSWAWRVARIRGIDIKIHTTFLFALAWGAIALGGREANGWLYGMFLTMLLFGVVLLHELGHAIAAQRYGVEVHDIVLLPIGGVARLSEMPENPRHELVIALAGPAVNLAFVLVLTPVITPILLGPALFGGALPLPVFTQPGIINLLVYLAAINLSLLIFNMVPAFPMDGGRVLRALLAMRLSLGQATRIAVLVGQGFSAVFVVGGLILGNFSLALVGLFIYFGAGSEGREVIVRERLRRLTVTEVMDRSAPVLAANAPAYAAFDRLMRSPHAAFAVVDESGALVGLVTRWGMQRQWAQGVRGPVSDFIEQPALAVECATSLDEARQRMAEAQAPVVAVYCGSTFEGLLDFEAIGRAISLSPARRLRVAG
jgi:Zn-dependent protease